MIAPVRVYACLLGTDHLQATVTAGSYFVRFASCVNRETKQSVERGGAGGATEVRRW